jgi:glycerol uptake facilitator-like aquaporin
LLLAQFNGGNVAAAKLSETLLPEKLEEDINSFFNNILIESIGTTVLIKLIINFFRSNNLIVNKFLLNFSILLCVIEEFLKENNFINKDKQRHLKRTSMFEIITDSQLDIICIN